MEKGLLRTSCVKERDSFKASKSFDLIKTFVMLLS